MYAKFSSLLATFLLVIANDVRSTYSECYVDQRIDTESVEIKSGETNCSSFTIIDCYKSAKYSLKHLSNRLLDVSETENGPEKLQLSSTPWELNSKLLLEATMNNISFKKLTIRLKSDTVKKYNTTCQTIDFGVTKNLNLSAFFSVPNQFDTTVEFLVEDNDSKYFRSYELLVPSENTLAHSSIAGQNHMLTYIDTTGPDGIRLYIQPPNEMYNVTGYNGTINCDRKPIHRFNMSVDQRYYEWNHFSHDDMLCNFYITPITNKCSGDCDLISASFIMHGSNYHITIMIVSVIFVPFAVFFGLRQFYVWYMNIGWDPKKNKPYCLLVHSGSPITHVNVMIRLAEYLRACDINAMIDVLDIPKETLINPNLWCQEAFEKATTIIVAARPPCNDDSGSVYKLLYNLALTLIHAKFASPGKQYIALKFPYCKHRKDIPPDVRSFPVLKLPEDLEKLVKKIHDIDWLEAHEAPPNQEFLNSIKIAKKSILNGNNSSVNINVLPFPSYLNTDSDEKINIDSDDSNSSDPDAESTDDEMWSGKDVEDENDEEIVEVAHDFDVLFSGNDKQ